MLEFTKGDMFAEAADIRVNTVNCVGVMGAGVALGFKKRYPEMFKDYQRDCRHGKIKPGQMHIWKSLSGDWIINFPTKRDWRDPSRYEDIDAGLDDLRSYLETVGWVTVVLPALGCGHGGLDWTRVSGMIRDKLGGVNARILVFEPAASHQAGLTPTAAPTDEERAKIEDLGYRLVVREGETTTTTLAYVLGVEEMLSHKWIAVIPSRAPAEREVQALEAIAAELAKSGKCVTVALVHSSHASENIAKLLLAQGIRTILLLPFGVLTRKSVARLSAINQSGLLTLASLAPAGAKWSRQLFAQAIEMLKSNSDAILLSDPQPDWFVKSEARKWSHIAISYVRYESMQSHQLEDLAHVGAKPIGRRSGTGVPNIDNLVKGADSKLPSGVSDEHMGPQVENPFSPTTSPICDGPLGGHIVEVNLAKLSKSEIRDLRRLLKRLDLWKINLTVGVSSDVEAGYLDKLRKFGADPQ